MTGNLSKTVFKKMPELYGQAGAFSGQRIVTQNDVVPVGILIAATAYM